MPAATRPLPTIRPVPPAKREQRVIEKPNEGGKKIMHQPLNEDQKAAAGILQPAIGQDGEKLEDNPVFQQFEDMTSVAAAAARGYRSWMLEHMKVSMSAALNYANGLASVNARTGSTASPDTPQQEKDGHSQSADQSSSTLAKVADEYRAKAFELMTSNVNTTLEYAQRLVNVKTPSEFVELSTSHARKQFESIMKQAAELGSIAQKLARYPESSE
jgi:hypothetical protein